MTNAQTEETVPEDQFGPLQIGILGAATIARSSFVAAVAPSILRQSSDISLCLGISPNTLCLSRVPCRNGGQFRWRRDGSA